MISENNENQLTDLVVPVKPRMENNDYSVDHLIFEDKSLLEYKGFKFRPLTPLPFNRQSFYNSDRINIETLRQIRKKNEIKIIEWNVDNLYLDNTLNKLSRRSECLDGIFSTNSKYN